MKNSLRQKILNELKFLLNEDDPVSSSASAPVASAETKQLTPQQMADAKNQICSKGCKTDYDLADDVQILIDRLDLYTSETGLGDIESIYNKYLGLNVQRKNGFSSAWKRIFEMYEDDEGGENLVEKIRKTKFSDIKLKTKAKEIADKIQLEIDRDPMAGYNSQPTPSSSGATGNFCDDPKNEGKIVPGLDEKFVCRNKTAVNVGQATPQGQTGVQGKNSFKCVNQQDVAVFQQYIGVKEDCSVGINTINAAKAKGVVSLELKDYFSAGQLTDQQKQNQIAFCNGLKTNRATYEAKIREAGQTVRGMCPAATGGGGRKVAKPQTGTNTAPPINLQGGLEGPIQQNVFGAETKKCPDGTEAPGGDMNKCPTTKESKNYYDNKKINEAKQLFNKLLKKL